MHLKSPKLLDDIVRSCEYIAEDTAGESLDAYLGNRKLRQVVERNLEIIGEALNRLGKVDPIIASRIGESHKIVGLRNRLAHGYDDEIDDRLVWESTQSSVPVLRDEATALLATFDD